MKPSGTSGEQELVQDSVKIEGDYAARVTDRHRDGHHDITAVYNLVKKDDLWLIRSLRVM